MELVSSLYIIIREKHQLQHKEYLQLILLELIPFQQKKINLICTHSYSIVKFWVKYKNWINSFGF